MRQAEKSLNIPVEISRSPGLTRQSFSTLFQGKSVLFGLLAFAAFASANTCTKAWFEIQAFNFLTMKDAPHLDSIYYRDQPNPEELSEWYQKYYYKDGLIQRSKFKFRDDDPVENELQLCF